MSKTPTSILGMSRALLLDRNVRVIAITSLISGVYIGMLNTLFQPYTIGLGIGVAALGVLQTLGGRNNGVIASIVQPLAGHYSDLFGRKGVILIGSATTIVSMFCFLLSALLRSPSFLLIAYLLYGLSFLSSPALQAMVAESVQVEASRMHVAFSAVFLLSTIPGAIMSFAAGPLVNLVGYTAIFGLAVVLESVDLLLFMRGLRETATGPGPRSVREKFSFRKALSLPPGFLAFFATFAMDSIAFGISTSIIYGIMVLKFGYSLDDISLLVGVFSISLILAQYPATRLLLRVGPKRSLAISELFGVAFIAGWLVSDSLFLFLLCSVLFGVSVATWVPAQQSLLMASSPPGERGGLGGKLAAYRGLVAFPAPALGGFLYETFGYSGPLLASLAAAVVSTVMIVTLLPEMPDPPSITGQ